MPTEDGYDPQKAGENVALNANCWDVYSKSDWRQMAWRCPRFRSIFYATFHGGLLHHARRFSGRSRTQMLSSKAP
jgi:hypothetical protein